MNQKKKKFQLNRKYIILFVILIAYVVLCIMVFGIKQNNENREEKVYIVLSPEHKFAYSDGKLISSLNWNQIYGDYRFYSYSDGVYLGQYTLMEYGTMLYLFDENNDSIDYSGTLFSYATEDNRQIDLINTQYASFDYETEQVLTSLLADTDISMPADEESIIVQKIPVDLDGDQDEEVLYSIRYTTLEEGESFSFLCYTDQDKLHRIVSNTSGAHFYSIVQALDLNQDGTKELIVRDMQYSGTVAVDTYLLYQLENGNYHLTSKEG